LRVDLDVTIELLASIAGRTDWPKLLENLDLQCF
jgi:hypothetical protein